MNNLKKLGFISIFFLIFIIILFAMGCTVEKAIEPRLLAMGFTLPEGPVLDKEGNLYLVNVKSTVINKVTPDGEVSVFMDTGNFNSGALFDESGNLYIASYGRKAILKINTDRELSVLTATSEGDSLLGPNDLVWGNEGRLYFTDPKSSNIENPIGGVHYIDIDGKTKRFAGGLIYPNGIAFDLDKTHLYISETTSSRILRFEANPDGSAGKRETILEMGEGVMPDGLKLDVNGNLWITVFSVGELWCISTEGKKLNSIQIPTNHVTNIAFGGKDMRTAYVTALDDRYTDTGKVFTIKMPVAGVPVIPE